MPNVNQLSKIQHVILFSCISGMNTISMKTIDTLNGWYEPLRKIP